MADYSITATSVKVGTDTGTRRVQYGEAVSHGQPVYLNTTDNKWYLADANTSVTTAGDDGIAIALTPGATDGYGEVVVSGTYFAGITLTEGDVVVLSATSGALAPVADLTGGMNVTIIGVAGANNDIVTILKASGQTVPGT